MAENQVTNNEYGKTVIASEVVAIIAGLAASEVPGVASMSSGFVDDFTTSLGMKSSKKGVKVGLADDVATIEVSIVVEYGVSIPEVVNNIRKRIIDAVQNMTGLMVDEVNIYVTGVKLQKEVHEPEVVDIDEEL